MVFDRARRIGRVFAVALLVWTAMDVLDYGVCANHQDPFPVCAPASVSGASPAGPGCPTGPQHDHVGDCFCCSPYVDVQVPFRVTLNYTVTWALPPEAMARPVFGAARLYHPPLA